MSAPGRCRGLTPVPTPVPTVAPTMVLAAQRAAP